VRTLILLRHAAAESQRLDGRDFDRALTPAGRAEAEAAGRRLAALDSRPQLLLTSPARRTRDTADILARCLGLAAASVRDDATLYLATVPALRAAIARTDAAIGCLLLLGHNPGLSELATVLDADGEGVALATGAFVRLDLPLADWSLP
jgi:phosphohistidine phosphatase